MKIETCGKEIDVNAENSVILYYPNDMMDGLYVNLQSDFMFITKQHDSFPEIRESAVNEGIREVDIPKGFNPEVSPHRWVILSIGQLAIQEAERIRDGE